MEVESVMRWRREAFCCLFLLFCGPMEGKYALICAVDILKTQMIVHIFSGFALLTKLM